ncbi:hypothetical protein [Novosphingobium sp. SG707]|uniref:hypothetical protein n=1 Tax=Novosphingobium sp. SG707 TaxID=2586996 RepID=UPI001445003C|nr:hypothetical protein [Novosphingobium sp. SG707]NKI99573.1 hypothetical protein [Novosphingobium sp. SG707]
MNQIDPELLERVVAAMREAARRNGADSPYTEIEAMARAAVGVVIIALRDARGG